MAICLLFALLYCELISFSKLFPSVITGCGSPWWVLSAPTSLSSFPCPRCCEFGGPTGSTSFGGQHLLVGSVTHATDQGTLCRLLGFSVGCYWHVQALLAWSCTGARAVCGILSFCCKTHGRALCRQPGGCNDHVEYEIQSFYLKKKCWKYHYTGLLILSATSPLGHFILHLFTIKRLVAIREENQNIEPGKLFYIYICTYPSIAFSPIEISTWMVYDLSAGL